MLKEQQRLQVSGHDSIGIRQPSFSCKIALFFRNLDFRQF